VLEADRTCRTASSLGAGPDEEVNAEPSIYPLDPLDLGRRSSAYPECLREKWTQSALKAAVRSLTVLEYLQHQTWVALVVHERIPSGNLFVGTKENPGEHAIFDHDEILLPGRAVLR
jgi:hypothetical protein